jgi:hypothetical protein
MRALILLVLFSFATVEAKQKFTPCIYYLTYPDMPNGEIAFINGINHKPKRAVKCLNFVGEMAGKKKAFAIYNPTDGLFGDLRKCYHELFKYKLSDPVLILHRKWNDFFETHTHGERYLQFCHSQGAIQVRNALLHYPEELRKRIIVVAIAPAAYISEAICSRAYHYVSRRDIVPYIDRHGRKMCKDTIVMLTPHQNAAFFDHHFLSPTFKPAIKYHLMEYLKEIGMIDDPSSL